MDNQPTRRQASDIEKVLATPFAKMSGRKRRRALLAIQRARRRGGSLSILRLFDERLDNMLDCGIPWTLAASDWWRKLHPESRQQVMKFSKEWRRIHREIKAGIMFDDTQKIAPKTLLSPSDKEVTEGRVT